VGCEFIAVAMNGWSAQLSLSRFLIKYYVAVVSDFYSRGGVQERIEKSGVVES
jgi:hypothetical protein